MDFSLLSRMSAAGLMTVLVLFFCSFLMMALAYELRRRRNDSLLDGEWLLTQIHYLLYLKKCDKTRVVDYLSQLQRPIANICRELLLLSAPTLESGDYLLSTLVDRERQRLETGLSHLGTLAVIAPFVGLFGTVVGITKTFSDVAKLGKAGIEVVSAGVSEALVATAIGLLVAIVSVVLFNTFKGDFAKQSSDWDLTGRALLSLLTGSDSDREELFAQVRQTHSTSSAERFLGEDSSNPSESPEG